MATPPPRDASVYPLDTGALIGVMRLFFVSTHEDPGLHGKPSLPRSLLLEGFVEERTVALKRAAARPVSVQLKHLEAARRDLVNYALRRDPEAPPTDEKRRRDVNHRQQPARAKRAQKARVGLSRIGQVMVDAAKHDRIAATCRQSGVV